MPPPPPKGGDSPCRTCPKPVGVSKRANLRTARPQGPSPASLARLRIVGHAHQAWNDSGLSFHARNARLQLHWILLRQCMLPELDTVIASG